MRLVFAWGPTPADKVQARLLGCEEVMLEQRIEDEPGAFRMYCHREALPELIAYARTLGRDCSYRPFADRQALLLVGPSGGLADGR